jgi:hypothetical protein
MDLTELRSLIAEQDREYMESLDIDRRRVAEAEARARAAEAFEAKARAVKVAAEVEARLAEAFEAETRAVKVAALEAAAGSLRVALRLPNGRALRRGFDPQCSTSALYAWAELELELELGLAEFSLVSRGQTHLPRDATLSACLLDGEGLFVRRAAPPSRGG